MSEKKIKVTLKDLGRGKPSPLSEDTMNGKKDKVNVGICTQCGYKGNIKKLLNHAEKHIKGITINAESKGSIWRTYP